MNTDKNKTVHFQASVYCLSTLKVLTITSLGLLSSCALTTPNYDSEFGEATRQTLSQQIANPNVGNNPDPVTGLDGRAAKDAMQNYQKSFQEPETSSYRANVETGGNFGNSGSNR